MIKKNFKINPPILLLFLLLLFIPIEYQCKLLKITPSIVPITRAFLRAHYFYLTDVFILLTALFLSFTNMTSTRMFFKQKQDSFSNTNTFFLKHKNSLFLFCILILGSFSLVFSPIETHPGQAIKLFYLGLSFLLFHLLQNQNFSKETLQKLLWIIPILAAFESIVGIAQYFTQDFIGLRLLGEPHLKPEDLHVGFRMTNPQRWIFDGIFSVKNLSHNFLRSYGTFSHPNVFSGYLLMSLFVSYFLFLTTKNPKKTLLLSIFLALQIFTLHLTFSRASFFSWIVLSAFFFFVYRKQFIQEKIYRKLLYIVILIETFSFIVLFPPTWDRGGIVNISTLSSESVQERIAYQNIAVEIIKKYPVLGVGFDGFSTYTQRFPSEHSIVVHNIYALMASEMGIFSLLFFILWIGSILKNSWRERKEPLVFLLLCVFLGFLLVGFADFYVLNAQPIRLLFFLFSGLLSALTKPKHASSIFSIEKQEKS